MTKREYIGIIAAIVMIAILLIMWSVSLHRIVREERTVEVNGVPITYLVKGSSDGKPIVLLHGNGGSHQDLSVMINQLAQTGYLVWAPDSRGQGANPPLPEYHYTDMADDIHCFVEQVIIPFYEENENKEESFASQIMQSATSAINKKRLEVKESEPVKPVVFGWSDGGIIALLTEVRYPGTWSAIVTSGANIDPDCGIWDLEEERAHPSDTSALYRMMLYEPNMTVEDMATIQCPCLIAAGENDLISIEHTHLIGDHIPHGQVLILQDEDHGSHIYNSPIMGRVMLDYLEEIDY